MADTIEFFGVQYRRYPNSKHHAHRNYYRAGSSDVKKGRSSLHVDKWKAAHGPIPEGYHVHHMDGDTSNNHITNLGLKEVGPHLSDHAKQWIQRNPERAAERTKAMQDAAKEWHGSEDGKKWHGEHYEESLAKATVYVHRCQVCNAKFQSTRTTTAKFCSNKCKAKNRRDLGLDDIEKRCGVCGKAFKTNRYRGSEYCSRACGAKVAGKKRRVEGSRRSKQGKYDDA